MCHKTKPNQTKLKKSGGVRIYKERRHNLLHPPKNSFLREREIFSGCAFLCPFPHKIKNG